VMAGKEQFSTLAVMSVVSNIVRGVTLIIAGLLHRINMPTVMLLFVLGDTAEFACTLYLYKRHAQQLRFLPDRKSYRQLLKEAMPQLGIVLSTSAMSRFDWLLLGIAVSDVQLAEYSFAYKVYEMITLPLLVIAPLLIPRFVKHYQQQRKDFSGFYAILHLEMLVASLIIVLVNLAWTPLVDALTGSKYGAVNSETILILSLCTPLLYISNLLWTSGFAQNRLRNLFRIICTTCLINIAGDCLLIPLLHKEGAALACLLALVIQTILYFRNDKQLRFARVSYPILCSPLCALTTITLIRLTPLPTIPALFTGVVLYILLTAICGLWARMELRKGIQLISDV